MEKENEITMKDDFPYELILCGADKITADYLVKQFKALILSNKFPAGYPLPNENTLCEKLGTGRSTLREAFSVLSEYGLITRTKHGTFINGSQDFSSSLVMDYRFEDSSILEILEFRKIFEVESAYLAAQHATTDDIKELKQLLITIKGCVDNPEALTRNDVAFHLAIARCTHNRLLIGITKLVADTYYKGILGQFELVENIGGMTTLEATIYHHNRIFDAILLKDSDAAADAMRDHMDSVLNEVRKVEI